MGNEVKVGIGGKVEGSFHSTVHEIKQGVRDAAKEIGLIALETAKADVHHRLLHKGIHVAWEATTHIIKGGLRTILPEVASVLGGLALLTGSVKLLSGIMHLFDRANGAINTGLTKLGQTEELTSRLKRLSGSAEAAKMKLGELADTFVGTNVTLPDAVDAYKNSEVMTGGQFSDKKGMTQLGDVAASSGNSLKETSAAIGKFYDDLHSGRPIEDAAKKLQDMGIISAEVHSKITGMLGEGKSGMAVWEMLTGEFKKSAGAMADARDNLTSLQQGLAQAKDRLYKLFAEDSLDTAKTRLKEQTQVVEALAPAAKEAGGLMAELNSSIGDTQTTIAKFENWVVKSAGDLQKWVDVLWVAIFAAGGFAAGVLLAAAAGLTLAAGVLIVGGAVVAAVAVIAGSFLVWAHHKNALIEAHLALMKASDDLVQSLDKQREAIKSVGDKAAALAKAYEALKKAKEDLANAKNPTEKEELQNRVTRIGLDIKKLNKIDDSSLTGSDPRVKSEKELKDLQDKAEFEGKDDHGKLDSLTGGLEDAKKKQQELADKWAQALADATEEGQADLQSQIEAAQAENTPVSKRHATELEQRKFGATGVAENARTEIAAQNVEVEKAQEEYDKQKKITEEKDAQRAARLGELAIEQRIAAVRSEGITKAREDWKIRREGLVTQLNNATGKKDELGRHEALTKINQGDTQMREQERSYADQERQIAADLRIAALQTEGVTRAAQESQIRLALIEARWKEAIAAKDTLAIDKERLAYYQEQVRHAQEVENIQRQSATNARELTSAKENRQDNQNKRLADAALAAGKITPEQRRLLEMEELRRKQREAYAEATRMDKEAKDAKAKGDTQRAERLAIDAEKSRKQGDTFGFDAEALSQQKPQKEGRPVASNLARIALGGNVAPSTQSPLLASQERNNKTLESAVTVLKEIRDKNRLNSGTPGVFGR